MIVGDLTPGTMSWARMTASATVDKYRRAEDSSDFISLLEEFARHGGWSLLGYDSLDAFIVKEIRETPEQVEHRFVDVVDRIRAARLLNVKPVAPHGGARTKSEEQDHAMVLHTDSAEGIAARLKRDGQTHLVEAMATGEITAAEARRQGGFAPRNTRVALHEDPRRAALRLVERFERGYLEQLLSALRDELGTP